MENPTVSGLRSRSRSKTPFLRSSCDHENCTEGEEHTHHKSGRRTPIRRSTPNKQLQQNSKKIIEIVDEEEEVLPVHNTRQSTRSDKLVKTSDYSSEESLDRLRGHRKEIIQNEINSQYERVSTSTHGYSTLADVTFSPINLTRNVTGDRSTRYSSPSFSACSTDSSFAEQALADASVLLERDPGADHLPYRLYKMAGEYWNKYPKTDYTYSPLSRDRVELAPGQVAVPNMSRRSLSQFRLQGPIGPVDEPDIPYTSVWKTSTVRKRITTIENSDDEDSYVPSPKKQQRWWLAHLLVAMYTSVSSAVSNTYRKVIGPSHRYPYTERRPKGSVMSSAASALAAPFSWMYTVISSVITTVTTVTETMTSNHVSEKENYVARKKVAGRRWWPWLLLLLLPAIGYGCYTYKDRIYDPIIDNYKSPEIEVDAGLARRVAALESWAMSVDSKLKVFDNKFSNFEHIESKIEQYSLKYLQNNLIQILNEDNTDAMAAKLKERFDKVYATSAQMQTLGQDILERLISSWKPELDEERIKKIIHEYLLTIEKRQMELIVEKVREYVREVEVRQVEVRPMGGGSVDLEALKKLVAGMLEVYDADKTGVVDYALESAGGQVLSTKCTELYQIKTKQYSVLGIPVLWSYTSPRNALTPGALPAECWAFQGFPGYLVIKTYAIIEVTGFSVEHMSRLLAVDGKIESAPRNFSVYGLQGEYDPEPHLFGSYMYDANGTSIQYFPVVHPKTTVIDGVEYPVAHDIIELRVESNHGNPTYTCLYRFRVHGNPVKDIHSVSET